jgi:hypothetical protein
VYDLFQGTKNGGKIQDGHQTRICNNGMVKVFSKIQNDALFQDGSIDHCFLFCALFQ